ncbi:RagB/SusD family nutrient uptake outer membrane protein [Dawidia soli]|uniref:RagB/SusD family nutrient uptake outer membrane protein n=1 Tax=Dawidia soli TaxID=2782352 RepID=A0AAP2DDV0_9BACT|nr:RagB/SusD family nutrient uptake outer membrane protein [Dawidia soli]MBT1689859.1 RagB/SusD family nutrient uptake outer membrane protein [Dawidia soli]
MVLLLTACESLIEIDGPDDAFTSQTVFEDDATATSAIRGVYSEMAAMPYFSNGGIVLLTGLSGDELIPLNEEYTGFYRADLKPDEPLLMNYLWRPAYSMIYNANAALKGLNNSRGTTKAVRRQLMGEALFIRAFSHFYLTNLFGPIPLLTEESFERNASVPRTNPSIVYDTIEADLIRARDLLSEDKFAFTGGEPGRIRPTSWAASALLARVLLYRGKWERAEAEASRVIAREDLFSLPSIHEVFGVSSPEAIWQLQANTPGMGSWDAMLFLPVDGALSMALQPAMLEAFHPDDQRRIAWIGSLNVGEDVFHYPAKYKSQYSQTDEYHMEFRLAELYLIRAEARARRDDLPGAFADLDMIRVRAGLPPLADSSDGYTVEHIIAAIQEERRAELFAEGGHRWMDLKRHDKAGETLGLLPGKDWQNTDVLYPIPQSEIEANPNLAPQNDGY